MLWYQCTCISRSIKPWNILFWRTIVYRQNLLWFTLIDYSSNDLLIETIVLFHFHKKKIIFNWTTQNTMAYGVEILFDTTELHLIITIRTSENHILSNTKSVWMLIKWWLQRRASPNLENAPTLFKWVLPAICCFRNQSQKGISCLHCPMLCVSLERYDTSIMKHKFINYIIENLFFSLFGKLQYLGNNHIWTYVSIYE